MISATLFVAAAVAASPALPARPPDATYTYALTAGGTTIGTSTITVDGMAAGAIVVTENLRFQLAQLTGFTSRDVRFTSADGTVLAGTLTVPDRGRKLFAAVVLVHGSGPADRDERVGPNPVFLQISNALSNAGYAVWRYDKRGVAQSGGRNTLGTRDQLLDDVRAAYRFARAQPEVDAKHVYLLGHSEGGELVPTVAAYDPSVAGLILLAPPALPLAQVLMEQALSGLAPDQRAGARARELAIFKSTRDAPAAVTAARGTRTTAARRRYGPKAAATGCRRRP